MELNMKIKSFLIFFLILVLLLMVIPAIVFLFQMIDSSFDDTWLGEMINKM
jgi:hypothetical protein